MEKILNANMVLSAHLLVYTRKQAIGLLGAIERVQADHLRVFSELNKPAAASPTTAPAPGSSVATKRAGHGFVWKVFRTLYEQLLIVLALAISVIVMLLRIVVWVTGPRSRQHPALEAGGGSPLHNRDQLSLTMVDTWCPQCGGAQCTRKDHIKIRGGGAESAMGGYRAKARGGAGETALCSFQRRIEDLEAENATLRSNIRAERAAGDAVARQLRLENARAREEMARLNVTLGKLIARCQTLEGKESEGWGYAHESDAREEDYETADEDETESEYW